MKFRIPFSNSGNALSESQRITSNCTPDDLGAVSFAQVKEREEEEIRQRRKAFDIAEGVGGGEELFGLAISGGGIRSATFSLGIIQRLAERQDATDGRSRYGTPRLKHEGLLRHIDYLSTVSGGGYIGSWLYSWIQREQAAAIAEGAPGQRELHGHAGLDEKRRGFEKVEESLRADHTHESEQITFLRQYSNYLTPRVSFFSADTWVVGAIWFRNMLLNLSILIAVFAAAVLAIRGLGLWSLHRVTAEPFWSDAGIWPLACCVGPLVPFVAWIGWNLLRNSKVALNAEPPADRQGEANNKQVLWFCVLPMLSSIAYSIWLGKARGLFVAGDLWTGVQANFYALLVAYFAVQVCVLLYRCHVAKQKEMRGEVRTRDRAAALLCYIYAPAASAFVTAALLRSIALLFETRFNALDKPWFIFTLGPPLVLTAFTFGMIVHIGLMGRDLPEASREWLGRLRGWLTIITLAWIGASGIAIYGAWLVAWVGVKSEAAVAGLSVAWFLSTGAGLLAGNSDKTSGKASDGETKPKSKTLLEMLAGIAPYIFMLGFTLAIAFGVHAILVHGLNGGPVQQTPPYLEKYDLKVKDNNVQLSREPLPNSNTKLKRRLDTYWYDLSHTEYWVSDDRSALSGLAPLLLVLVFAGGLLACRVDINVFSMFHFYKNRLVRCYLGASRQGKRKPSPFTGFDDFDDTRLCCFTNEENYVGPYPIMNAALNVTSGGKLQYQERQAQSFVFTPLFTGFSSESVVDEMRLVDSATRRLADYQEPGERGKRGRATVNDAHALAYRPTAAAGGGASVGMAMAISGAAANPNMGYHTSLAVSFLLTVFNVRLGWWFGNALKKTFNRPGPKIGLIYQFRELFGLANADSSYVSLSDGGHFDNMGIYELVRRGCRYIICCDGEQDENFTFNGIGNAIRKCRTDFGVDIDLPTTPLRKEGGFSTAHCVVGKIKYPRVSARGASASSSKEGYILYLKASLTGDEATDVLEYRSRQPAFPHQTTGDQWFDESQFESYRRLGYHIADKALSELRLDDRQADGREKFFRALSQIWYPRSTAVEKNSPAHAEIYGRLLETVRREKDLGTLDGDLFEGYAAAVDGWNHNSGHLCNSFIQFMERVFYDLGLEDGDSWDHPYVAGWLDIFRYWVNRDVFRKAWAVTKDSYPERFCSFYESLATKAAASGGHQDG